MATAAPETVNPAEKSAELALKGLLTGLGAKIFDYICTDESASYIKGRMYDLTMKIMKMEMPDKYGENFNRTIYDVCRYMREEYLTAKPEVGRITLRELLAPKYLAVKNLLLEIVSSLSKTKVTIELFVLVASMELLILQELAMIDPATENDSQKKCINDIRALATESVNLLKTHYKTLVRHRNELISYVTIRTTEESPRKCTAMWMDKLTNGILKETTEEVDGEWNNGSPSKVNDRSKYSRASHQLQALKDMEKDFKLVNNAITIWSLLQYTPLPK